MHKISSRIVLLTLVGALTAVSPAFAAPMGGNGGGGQPPGAVDCKDPANAQNQFCLKFQKGGMGRDRQHNNMGGSNNQGGNMSPPVGSNPPPPPPPPTGNPPPPPNGGNGQNGNGHGNNFGNGDHKPPMGGMNGMPPMGGNGGPPPGFRPPPPGTFNFGQRDRDQFHQFFRGFDFGYFAAPNFDVSVGAHVPRFFKLQPVPRQIYRYYPWFRNYLFFTTRDGDWVIVSPRSYRIVAII